VAEQLEHPERVAGPPVVLVAVEDDRGVRRQTQARGQRFEAILADVVAANLIVEVGRPVHVRRARHVTGSIEQRVLVRLDDADLGVVEMIGDPVGRDQDVGMNVSTIGNRAHVNLFPKKTPRTHPRPSQSADHIKSSVAVARRIAVICGGPLLARRVRH
jgi:hypothetical protein